MQPITYGSTKQVLPQHAGSFSVMLRQSALDVAHGYDFERFSLPDEKIPRHGYAPTYSALPYGIETYLNPLITPHSSLFTLHSH